MTTPTAKIALIAITKNGAAQINLLAKKLPDADIVVSEKFASLMTDTTNKLKAYSGPFRNQIAPLFSDYDQLVIFVSLRSCCQTHCSTFKI